jgi:hypothetical protein
MPQLAQCFVAFRLGSRTLNALKVCIEGEDVYVNDLRRDGVPQNVHTSYHASGQRHMKIGHDCYPIYRVEGSGERIPLKSFKPRPASVRGRENICCITWRIEDGLAELLPLADFVPDFLVDTTPLAGPLASLAIDLSVVVSVAVSRKDVGGYPILASFHLVGDITVELAAFCVAESWPSIISK